MRSAESDPLAVKMPVTIRPVAVTDLPAIEAVYGGYVRETVVSFDEEPLSLTDWYDKFEHLAELNMPFLVVVDGNEQFVGYAYVSPWRDKPAYRYTVEDTIYLKRGATGYGIGATLLGALLTECEARGFREVVSVIADPGVENSVRLHEKLGFIEIGRLPRVGHKFDRWLGVIIMQKSLGVDNAAE